MQFMANIKIELKESVNDPQGSTVMHSLHSLGYSSVSNVRIGKFISVEISAEDQPTALAEVHQMCGKLLANPVIESFKISILEI